MKTPWSLSVVAILTAFPLIASALNIQPADFYDDVRATSQERAGINLLTRENIVRGYGNRIFGPTRIINRAEFLKIAMLASGMPAFSTGQNCFPDVLRSDWFSTYVCAAKDKNIVRGLDDGHFHPEYTVTYGEALKMLTLLFGYDVMSYSGHWAEPYYRAAAEHRVDLPITIDLDHPLTRGQAARLAAAFFAHENGQLTALRMAEAGIYGSSSSSVRSSSSSVNSSSSSSVGNRPLDPLTDTAVRTQFVLLGDVSPIIGSAKLFIEEEPLDVTAISVNLMSAVSTVQSLLIYDDERRYLGRANLNTSTSSTNRNYRLELPAGTYVINKREQRGVYVRAQMTAKDAGGLSGQSVQISNVVAEGDGVWSSTAYTKQSGAGDVFPVFVTSRSTITSVTNAGQAQAPLVTGTNQLLGSFTFAGRKTDSSAKINVTDLIFQIEQTGQVTLSNVRLGTPGIPDRHDCLVGASTVTCSTIPESIGSVTDGPRTIALYGDIVAGNTVSASLRLTLNEPGSSSTAGSVTWTDGTTSFLWLGVDAPVALGTYYTY